jgi:hypothetical protein
MASRKCCDSGCDNHAIQRSLYRHALNALQLATRSGCASKEALELAERCEELLRAAGSGEPQSVAQLR